MAAAAQLPHAQPDFRRDVFGTRPRVGQQDRGLGGGRVGVAVGDEGGGQFKRADRGGSRVQRSRQPPCVAAAQVLQVDALVAERAQRDAEREDGGWMFNWLAWSPDSERDWRGFLTVDALRVLRANGRWG